MRNGAAKPVDLQPDDHRFSYRNIRYNVNERERDILGARMDQTWSHARPNSVYVAAIGAHWRPGSWQRVLEMVDLTNNNGFFVALEEIMDRCFQPYDSLGAMRNEAILRAQEGFDWLLYVDNDVLPQPDTLLRLLKWDMPIIAPFVFEPETNKPLHGPIREPYTGLQPIKWAVLSMLLFRTNVFHATGFEFWNNSIGADEGYHFQKLWHVGHRPYLDTTLILPVYQKPTYPLATNRMTEAESKSFWDQRREWLLAPPDRRPINPQDTRQQNGEFLPFLVPTPHKNGLFHGTVPIRMKAQ